MFSIIWGICFSLEAKPSALKTFDSRTVRAQSPPAWQVSPEGRRFLDGAEIFGVPIQEVNDIGVHPVLFGEGLSNWCSVINFRDE
jgi:hypothetical protein